jgi:hypothetical protein
MSKIENQLPNLEKKFLKILYKWIISLTNILYLSDEYAWENGQRGGWLLARQA